MSLEAPPATTLAQFAPSDVPRGAHVRIIHSDEMGIDQWAIIWDTSPQDSWLWAFFTQLEAVNFCRWCGWKVIDAS